MVRRTLIVAGGLLALVLGAASGGFLVVDEPRKSDVIIVLAGETDRRPARALELFDQGYASKIVLDVPAQAKIYRWTQAELAQKYVDGLSQAAAITICKITGLSTKAEAKDAARCLDAMGGGDEILGTSSFYTRDGVGCFRHGVEEYRFTRR